MNIAFLLKKFPKMSQTFVLSQITGLIDRGQNVDIYAYAMKDKDINDPLIENYQLLDRTFYYGSYKDSIPRNKAQRFITASACLGKNITNGSGPLLKSLNVFKFGREAASLDLFFKTHKLINIRNKYDVFHCHFGPNGVLAAKLKSVGLISGKLITTFHGYDVWELTRKYGENYYKNLFEVGDLFLPVSYVMKNELIRLGCDPGKIVVHRMGVKTDDFTPVFNKKNKNTQLLTVGRLVEKKGVKFALLSFSETLKRFPDLEYKIVGDGPLMEDLQELVARLGLENKVELLGWKGQVEIRRLMSQADVFIAPSVVDAKGDQEGVPVVLMEAMASGLPIISTFHSGIPELVEDGVSGFLVSERDTEALTERLGHLLDHPESWTAMGEAGRKRVKDMFDIDKLNDKLVQLYSAKSIPGELATSGEQI